MLTGLTWQVQAKEYTFKENQTSCDEGQSAGCFNLGIAYGQGKGVAKDLTKAAQLYEKACSMENDDACLNLGAAYYQSLGVAKNTAKAIQFSDKACRLGNSGGCKNAKIMRNSK